MSKILENLQRLFEKHRVILWYDEEQLFNAEFESLWLPGVQKIEIQNNEFAIKYRILEIQPTDKFLLYAPHTRPSNEDNWFLDIELSNHVFQTDQEAMFLQELGLPGTLRYWAQRHVVFFQSKERIQRFREAMEKTDNEAVLTAKLLMLVLGAAGRSTDELLRAYAIAWTREKHQTIEKDLERFGLTEPFWTLVEAEYNYSSANPGVYDFILELFQKGFSPFARRTQLNQGAAVLLSAWKDARSFEETYRKLSARVEADLNVSRDIAALSLEDLLHEDVFEQIDKRIIKDLALHLSQGTLGAERAEYLIKQRETRYWQDIYRPFYQALRYANRMLEDIRLYDRISIHDLPDGFKQYTEKWFLVDQDYRLFLQYYRETNQNNVLNVLYQAVHKAYSNTWLLKLSEKWQQALEKEGGWYFGPQSQRRFFQRAIKPRYLDPKTKVFVVISDALRYECGEDLHARFTEEARFSSTLDYQIAGLPSYTQLGMASLLPHQQLAFGREDEILIDGKSTLGAQARKKVLEEHSGVRATTILAEDLMKLASRSNEAQELIQNHDLIYVYHNQIDKIGDDKTSEEKVIEAARDEVEFLLAIARKISNLNGYHIVFTSDHGFVYQHEPLEDSDFADAQISGEIIKENRRYVLGRGLEHNQQVTKYQATDLQIESDCEVLIPKGINRLRIKGAGSRYVHGGSTLQEVVVPVLFVSKKKADTVQKVEIDVLNKGNNRITTNLQTVKFYQQQAVGGKYTSRKVKAFFAEVQDEKKKLLSDSFTYTFDLDSSRSEDREVSHQFKISTSMSKVREVFLFIEEQVDGSSKWNTLLKLPYTLNLAIENDFDDF